MSNCVSLGMLSFVCIYLLPILQLHDFHHEHMNRDLNWIINQDLCNTYLFKYGVVLDF